MIASSSPKARPNVLLYLLVMMTYFVLSVFVIAALTSMPVEPGKSLALLLGSGVVGISLGYVVDKYF